MRKYFNNVENVSWISIICFYYHYHTKLSKTLTWNKFLELFYFKTLQKVFYVQINDHETLCCLNTTKMARNNWTQFCFSFISILFLRSIVPI